MFLLAKFDMKSVIKDFLNFYHNIQWARNIRNVNILYTNTI